MLFGLRHRSTRRAEHVERDPLFGHELEESGVAELCTVFVHSHVVVDLPDLQVQNHGDLRAAGQRGRENLRHESQLIASTNVLDVMLHHDCRR